MQISTTKIKVFTVFTLHPEVILTHFTSMGHKCFTSSTHVNIRRNIQIHAVFKYDFIYWGGKELSKATWTQMKQGFQ